MERIVHKCALYNVHRR